MPGQIPVARFRSPIGSRGPGRVISMSRTGRTSPFLTAVMAPHPARAFTLAGVGLYATIEKGNGGEWGVFPAGKTEGTKLFAWLKQ